MADGATFRQRLDAILRTTDVARVREFLIAEHQWTVNKPANPEAAMWMMIAASPVLRILHEQAGRWLADHDHIEEAQAILGRGGQSPRAGRPPERDWQPRPQNAPRHDGFRGSHNGPRPPRRRP